MYRDKHTLYWCKDCDKQFLTKYHQNFNLHNPFCPYCGNRLYVEVVKHMWMDVPFMYRKRYTQEEDDIIIESVRRGIDVRDIEIDGRSEGSIRLRYDRLCKKGLIK